MKDFDFDPNTPEAELFRRDFAAEQARTQEDRAREHAAMRRLAKHRGYSRIGMALLLDCLAVPGSDPGVKSPEEESLERDGDLL